MWLTVGEEERLAFDLRPGLGCVETLNECELGALADPGSVALDPARLK